MSVRQAAFWWTCGAVVVWSATAVISVLAGFYTIPGVVGMVVAVAIGQYVAFQGGARFVARHAERQESERS